MLSVILTILKILGIILLCILGLIILIICLMLFVPVRYRAKGYYKDKEAYCKLTASYLLHIIHVSFVYDKEADFSIRLFGIKLGKHKKKNKKIKSSIDNSQNAESIEEVDQVQEVETTNTNEASADEPVKIEAVKENTSADSKSFENIEEDKKAKKTGFIDKLNGMKGKADYYKEMINRPSTKQAFITAKSRIGKAIKSVLPKKGKIDIEFGLDDCGTTGKIVGAYYSLYAYIGKVVHLYPVYNDKIINVEADIKGRIFSCVLLYQIVRLYFDKNCNKLIKGFLDDKKKG